MILSAAVDAALQKFDLGQLKGKRVHPDVRLIV